MCGFLFQWDFGGLSWLIGEVSVFVPVGFWWLIWVDQWWRKLAAWVFLFHFFFFFLLWLGLIGVWVHEFLCVHQWLRACWNRFGFSNCVMCMMRGRSILVEPRRWWCGDWWWWSRGGGGVVIDDGGAVEVWCGGGVVMVEPLESCQVWKVWKKN